jgi:hypothetical protein
LAFLNRASTLHRALRTHRVVSVLADQRRAGVPEAGQPNAVEEHSFRDSRHHHAICPYNDGTAAGSWVCGEYWGSDFISASIAKASSSCLTSAG